MSGENRFGKFGEQERTMRSWLETLEALDEIPVGTPAWREKYEEWDRAFHAWAREAIKTGYPNPERKGCPPVEVILAMAGHTLDLDDPAHDHAVRCSPCFNELWEIQGGIGN
jgi:hypothetical protein